MGGRRWGIAVRKRLRAKWDSWWCRPENRSKRLRLGQRWNSDLEPFMRLVRSSHDRSRDLDDIDGASSKPWTLELCEEGPFDDQCADTGGEAEHLVERDGHCINAEIGKGERTSRGECCSIHDGVVPQRRSISNEWQVVLAVSDIWERRENEETRRLVFGLGSILQQDGLFMGMRREWSRQRCMAHLSCPGIQSTNRGGIDIGGTGTLMGGKLSESMDLQGWRWGWGIGRR